MPFEQLHSPFPFQTAPFVFTFSASCPAKSDWRRPADMPWALSVCINKRRTQQWHYFVHSSKRHLTKHLAGPRWWRWIALHPPYTRSGQFSVCVVKIAPPTAVKFAKWCHKCFVRIAHKTIPLSVIPPFGRKTWPALASSRTSGRAFGSESEYAWERTVQRWFASLCHESLVPWQSFRALPFPISPFSAYACKFEQTRYKSRGTGWAFKQEDAFEMDGE